GMARGRAGAEVALAGHERVRERRRAQEGLVVRRAAALGRAARPGALLRRVPEPVLDVPAHDALRLGLRECPDTDVRFVRSRAQEADAAGPVVEDVDLPAEQLRVGV